MMMQTSSSRQQPSEKAALLAADTQLHRPYHAKVGCRKRAALLSAVAVGAVLYSFHAGRFLSHLPSKKSNIGDSDICMTPSCIHASSELLYNLSPDYKKIDPCTNFEDLVCGGWKERHDLRADQGTAFTGTIMAETSQTILRHILEGTYPGSSSHSYFSPMRLASTTKSTDEKNFQKMKDAYSACMDEDAIKTAGLSPLAPILDQITEYFKDSGNEALSSTLAYLWSLGASPLIGAGIGADDKDPDTVVVSLWPGRIGLPSKEYYTDEKVVSKYQKALGEVMAAIFPERSFAKSAVQDVIDLEKKAAAVSPDNEDMEDVTKYYNPMSLEETDALIPQFGLSKLLSESVPSNFSLDGVIVTFPRYFANLSAIISETSKETLQTFFTWKAVQSFSSAIESDAITPLKRFNNELQGKDADSKPERWRTCVSHVDGGIGWILSRFFVEKAFSAKAKEFGDQMVTDIKTEFIKKLKATEWMEDDVVDLAINKVHNIVQKIGYPTEGPDIMDPDSIYKYYESLDVSPSAFFNNEVSVRRFDEKSAWQQLGKPVDRNRWDMTVPTVNAYYNPPGNEIVFPAGIMQFPVFDVDVPHYLSYGAFASVAGHELSHAFDSTGRHYDENGTYTDWWTNATVKAFEKRADCFVEQYSNFTIDGPDGKKLHVNGRLTLGENIADAGGVAAAFAAWKRRAGETPNQNLPGLDFFSQEQLFFVNYANWWCGKTRKESAVQSIYTDPHSPKWARILGTMANSREFRQSFQCPVKEPVCKLW